MLLLAMAAAAAAARLDVLDRRLEAAARADAAVQAPLVTLLAHAERLALRPADAARQERLMRLSALIRLLAPAAEAAEARFEAERRAIATERAGLVLTAMARAAGTRPRGAPIAPAECPHAAWALPPAVFGVPPSFAARLDGIRGLALIALPGAIVPAPAAARIAYAGQFRRYRGTLILDHGHGWTTLVTGLDRLSVQTGERLTAGQPLGRAARALPVMGIALSHHGRPIPEAILLAHCLG